MVSPAVLLALVLCGSAPHGEYSVTADTAPFTVSGENLMHVTAPHPYSREEARARVGYLLDYWNHRFGIKGVWVGNQCFMTGRVWGIDFKARFEVGETDVSGEATDPGWLVRARAQAYVEKKLKKYLHPTYQE